MRLVLILRTHPGADATERRAVAMGLTAMTAPLFEISRLAWTPPDPAHYDAVIMTSAQAARLGGEALGRFIHLPLFAVGAATAEAARAAGFDTVIRGESDGASIIALAASQGKTRLLHLAGREHIALSHPAVSIDRRIVYAADPLPALPAEVHSALDRSAVVLLHSPRAATLFGQMVDAEGLERSAIPVAAFSSAVLDAAGVGWAATAVAPSPNDDALLAIAAQLCDQDAVSRNGGGEDRT
jgi:uroporphyrinogen-III synthase